MPKPKDRNAASKKAVRNTAKNTVSPISKGKGSKVDLVLSTISEIELWQTESKAVWATMWNGKGYANYPIGGRSLNALISYHCRLAGITSIGRETLSQVNENLESRALYEGQTHELCTRIGGDINGDTYIDLASEDHSAVKLSAAGWEIVKKPPVKFKRNQSMKSLPIPKRGGTLEPLKKLINCDQQKDWVLLLSWILMAMTPIGRYPVLVFVGPTGATKSTTSKIVRSLIDPNVVLDSGMSKDTADLIATVDNNWIVLIDNVSKMSVAMSDAWCRVAIGGGVRERKFHTNSEEHVVKGARPMIGNGIEVFITQSDLNSRSLTINLATPSERRPEFLNTSDAIAIWGELEAELPSILGALYDVFCKTLYHFQAGVPTPKGNPRMFEYAVWGNAVEQAMGWPEGIFDHMYGQSRLEADAITLENSIVYQALIAAFPDGSEKHKDTPTNILKKLKDNAPDSDIIRKLDNINAAALGAQLSWLSNVLKGLGWVIESGRSNSGRWWSIEPPDEKIPF